MIRITTGFSATGFIAVPVLSAPVTEGTSAVGMPSRLG